MATHWTYDIERAALEDGEAAGGKTVRQVIAGKDGTPWELVQIVPGLANGQALVVFKQPAAAPAPPQQPPHHP
jgi:hypothetical protein